MGIVRCAGIRSIDGLWHVAETIRGLAMAPSIAAEQPYGTGPRKPYLQRLRDTATWAIKHHEPHEFYNLYEMDLSNSNAPIDPNTLLDKHTFMITRDQLNLGDTINQATVLRDKRIFGIFMTSVGIPTPAIQGVMRVGQTRTYFDLSLFRTIDPTTLSYPLFVKVNDGESGYGVHKVEDYPALERLALPPADYILQEPLEQHPTMDQLGATSVNTCRIATILANGECEILAAIARCGTKSTGNVDNTSSGGMAIGITEQGVLQGMAYRDPEFGGRLAAHPDTGVLFDGFKVPFYDQAIDVVKRAHKALPRIASIGWDVAITTEGPVLIEGNDNYEIHSLQMCNGKGLKREWNDFVAKRSAEQPATFRHIHV